MSEQDQGHEVRISSLEELAGEVEKEFEDLILRISNLEQSHVGMGAQIEGIKAQVVTLRENATQNQRRLRTDLDAVRTRVDAIEALLSAKSTPT